MLKEVSSVRQKRGEPRRRWFSSETLDLIVWFDAADSPCAFQLCYDVGADERALTWNEPDSFSHAAVDDGEGRDFRHKSSPILKPGSRFDAARVAALFAAENAEVPREISELVAAKIAAFGSRR
jgi:hypothetical protein